MLGQDMTHIYGHQMVKQLKQLMSLNQGLMMLLFQIISLIILLQYTLMVLMIIFHLEIVKHGIVLIILLIFHYHFGLTIILMIPNIKILLDKVMVLEMNQNGC